MSFGIIGSILSVIVGAAQVYSSVENRKANKKAASSARAAADLQAARKARELDRLRGAQRVAFARAGVKLDGTPTAIIEDSQDQGQLDINLIKLQGAQDADYYDSLADQSRNDTLISGVSLASRLF